MEGNNIYIKNMVCKRCILTVSNIFQENCQCGIRYGRAV